MSKRRKSSRKAKRKSRVSKKSSRIFKDDSKGKFKVGIGSWNLDDKGKSYYSTDAYKEYIERLKANSKVLKINPEEKSNDGIVNYQIINPAGLLDTSSSTNTQSEKIIEIKKTLDKAVKINPPVFALDQRLQQIIGRSYRHKTLLEQDEQKNKDQIIKNTIANNRLSRPIRVVPSNRDTVKRIKELVNKLLEFYKVKNVKDLIPIYLKGKPNSHIRTSLRLYSFTEVSTLLRLCGLRANEVLEYTFERMFATKANKTMHSIRKTPLINRFENGQFVTDDENPQDGVAGIELVSQWLIYTEHNKTFKTLNWKQRKNAKAKYTMSMFHKSNWYKEWCIRYSIPFEKHYPAFTKFLKQAIRDYRRYQLSAKRTPLISKPIKASGQL